jgi:hypothetical protein
MGAMASGAVNQANPATAGSGSTTVGSGRASTWPSSVAAPSEGTDSACERSSWVWAKVEPGGTTPGKGRTERASRRPSRPAPTLKATTVPGLICREPSVMAVQ